MRNHNCRYDQKPKGTDQRPNLHHVGVRCFDLPLLVKHMQAHGMGSADGGWHLAGMARAGEIQQSPSFRYVMVSDPDGLLLEVYEDRDSLETPWPEERRAIESAGATDPLAGLYFSHAHIFSSNPERTTLWLAKAFGARVAFELKEAAGARNIWINIGGGGLNLYDQSPKVVGDDGIGLGTPRNLVHHLGVRTDNLDALLAHLREAGLEYRLGAVGDEKRWKYAMCAAPDNLLIEIFENCSGFNPDEHGAP